MKHPNDRRPSWYFRSALVWAALSVQAAGCLLPVVGSTLLRSALPSASASENPSSASGDGIALPKTQDDTVGAAPSTGGSGIAGSTTPAALVGKSPSPDGRLVGTNQGGLIDDGGAVFLSPRSLVGTVSAPDAKLVGNNAGGLIDDGGAVFLRLTYRLASLPQQGVAGALISLYSIDGRSVSAPPIKTDAAGRFALIAPGSDTAPLFVQADFNLGGQDFQFSRLVSPASASAASADVDAYTTLADEKLRRGIANRSFGAGSFDTGRYFSLIEALRSSISAENIPVMARRASEDLVPLFDQLAIDDAAFRTAAGGVGAAIASPSESWIVSTIFDSDSALKAGIVSQLKRDYSAAGSFEVDAAGNLYLPTFRTLVKGIEIIRVAPTGEAVRVAELPTTVRGPVQIAFSPVGQLHVVGFVLDEKALVVYRLGSDNKLARVPGSLGGLLNSLLPGDAGRVAVDSNGQVITALAAGNHVAVLDANSGNRTEIGGQKSAGLTDGPAQTAQFSRPMAVTIGGDGAIFVVDTGNNAIRRIDPQFNVRTVSGMTGIAGYRSGRASRGAAYSRPLSIVVDPAGNLVVLDAGNFRLRRISRAGSVFLIAGSGKVGYQDGPGTVASFLDPRHLSVDGAGNLYLLDSREDAEKNRNDVIRKVTRLGSPKLPSLAN